MDQEDPEMAGGGQCQEGQYGRPALGREGGKRRCRRLHNHESSDSALSVHCQGRQKARDNLPGHRYFNRFNRHGPAYGPLPKIAHSQPQIPHAENRPSRGRGHGRGGIGPGPDQSGREGVPHCPAQCPFCQLRCREKLQSGRGRHEGAGGPHPQGY